MRNFFAVILFLFPLIVQAKTLRIGLFEQKPIKELTIKYNIGRYSLFSDVEKLPVFQDKNDLIQFKVKGDKIEVFRKGVKLKDCIWFRLDKRADNNGLFLFPYGKELRYRGDIVVYANNGRLQVVNEIDIEEYVQGVLKGEVGYGYQVEYYKVQSVISRTYALFLHKHKEEGFDLCDHTHCQVYKGVNYDLNITEAVKQTKGDVIVDASANYINTLFHSNCGGETVTSDYVWGKKLNNLESVKDDFCTKSSQASWSKSISKDTWVRYLSNKLNKKESFFLNKNLDFIQGHRKKFYEVGEEKIKLTEIRTFFNLKSAFFSVHDIGDKVVLTGRGFGHGVGLCQEGAIEMSIKGYSYKEILSYYYANVFIINAEELDYFLIF